MLPLRGIAKDAQNGHSFFMTVLCLKKTKGMTIRMKKAVVILLCVSALGFGGFFLILQNNDAPPPDTVALNDAAISALQSGDSSEAARILTEDLVREYAAMDAARSINYRHAVIFLCVLLGALTVAGIWLILYCERSVLSPFRKLRHFAQNVASGNLDLPLEMDRRGAFGAFTESFDLMREELKIARENERKASQSKKELVASLSHDIKTPIASIKAVTELMMAKSQDSAEQLEVIIAKADQIDLLITNMFHATLEELEQLKVEPEEAQSTILYELIQNADYDHRIAMEEIPECIVTVDKTRLQQVFDNIISNSYKYAGTGIAVVSYFEEPYLAIEVRDTGPGVAHDDLPLIFEKFYRGGNTAGISGSGLGLYISRHFMNKMGGDLKCVQNEDGFTVKILLPM